MTLAATLLPEFDHEMATTRRVLERVPDAHRDWRPHEKSWPLGGLAIHVANVPFWQQVTLETSELDLAPPGGPAFDSPVFTSTAAALALFDRNVAGARAALAAASDADLAAPWTLAKGGRAVFTLPRVAAIRTFVLSHLIHHRGQLTVYLRLKDVPLPAIYGPSADDAGGL